MHQFLINLMFPGFFFLPLPPAHPHSRSQSNYSSIKWKSGSRSLDPAAEPRSTFFHQSRRHFPRRSFDILQRGTSASKQRLDAFFFFPPLEQHVCQVWVDAASELPQSLQISETNGRHSENCHGEFVFPVAYFQNILHEYNDTQRSLMHSTLAAMSQFFFSPISSSSSSSTTIDSNFTSHYNSSQSKCKNFISHEPDMHRILTPD